MQFPTKQERLKILARMATDPALTRPDDKPSGPGQVVNFG